MNGLLAFVVSAVGLASTAMAQSNNTIPPGELVQFQLTADNLQALCIGAASNAVGAQLVGTRCGAVNTAFDVSGGSDEITQLVLAGTALCITGRGASASVPMSLAFCEDDDLERWIYTTANSSLTRTSAPDAGDCITLAAAAVNEPISVQPCASNAAAAQQWIPFAV